MAFSYNYIKLHTAEGWQSSIRVPIIDQNTMTAYGSNEQTNTGTMRVGTKYRLNNACLCKITSTSHVAYLEGTDDAGNTYQWRDNSTTPSANTAGYYINGNLVMERADCGSTGKCFLVLIRELDEAATICHPLVINDGLAAFENGVCLTDGDTMSFEDNRDHAGRMIKINFSQDDAVLMCNNGSGNSDYLFYPFNIGVGYEFEGNLNVDPYEYDLENPYNGGGYAGPGGGDPSKQNWDEDSDFVEADSMPDETSVGALNCGLITIFSPTNAQMTRLAEMLWGKDFWDFVVNAITNIEDLFISFGVVPFTITDKTLATVTWYNWYTQAAGTPAIGYAPLYKVSKQFYEFDMGTVHLDGTDGFASDSVLDYSPYSRLGVFLPFIGYQELDIDECRGNDIHLIYRIDILSGACLARIIVSGRELYQFSGNCLTQLPLTSQDTTSAIGNAVNIGIAAASVGATGAIASAGEAVSAERNMTAAETSLDSAQRAARVSNANGNLASASANAAMGIKPNFKKSGAISGACAMLGVKQPYLFLTTPRQSMPDGYEKVCGFPCNEGGKLGNFTGYTVVEDIRLNGLVATAPEVDEIYQLLKSGVII